MVDEIIAQLEKHREDLLQDPETLQHLAKFVNVLTDTANRRKLIQRGRERRQAAAQT